MNMDLITIIIPVYKTEKYLDQCIDSVVNQTYRNLEIILVDDGSPDNCPQMCDTWAEKDCRIRVIHKENGGLSSARNVGIEEAKGEYICFFDSDDFIAVDTIECAYKTAKEKNVEAVLFGFATVDVNGNKITELVPKPEKQLYIGQEVQREFLPAMVGPDPRTGVSADLYMSACMCLLNVDMLKRSNHRFRSEKEIISEDCYFWLGLCKYVNSAAVLSKALYYYRENQQSLSRSYRPDRFQKNKFFYEECIKLCEECGYSEEVIRRCADPFLSFTIAAMKQEVAFHKNRKASIQGLRKIIDDSVLQEVLKERKSNKTGIMRKILFWAMRNKMYYFCYLLVAARNG